MMVAETSVAPASPRLPVEKEGYEFTPQAVPGGGI